MAKEKLNNRNTQDESSTKELDNISESSNQGLEIVIEPPTIEEPEKLSIINDPRNKGILTIPQKTIVNQSSKKMVMLSFEFVNIGVIDTMNEKFQAELIIQSKWEVYPDLEKNRDILNEYDPDRHWNPKLYIENAINVREEIDYEPSIEGDRYFITETRNTKGFFWVHLKLKNFPVDVQELEIAVTSKIGLDELELVKDEAKVSFIIFDATLTFRDQQKWKLFRLVTTKTEAIYEKNADKKVRPNKHKNMMKIVKARKNFKPSKIVATCYAARRPGFYLMNAFFLVFLITMMALANFSINLKLPHFRLQTTYVILLTSISFKWVVNRSLPPISYLTSLDAYQISSICFICLLAVWHAIVGAPRLISTQASLDSDKWLLMTFGIIFCLMQCCYIAWGYIAYSKVRDVKRAEEEYFEDHKDQFYHMKG